MSQDFLSRWSRLKRQGGAHDTDRPAESDAPAPPAPQTVSTEGRTGKLPPASEPLSIDLSALPPIEAIDASTDIRVFLQPGVPVELARAALRRAWSADPAIRNFIGLAENAWDFNAPEGVPGFGPTLSSDAARRLLADAVGGMSDESVVRETTSGPPQPVATERDLRPGTSSEGPQESAKSQHAALHNEGPDEEAAAGGIRANPLPLVARRRHGGALPQ
jgi:hypothetical protein